MSKLVGISFGVPLFVVGLGGMIFAIHGLVDPAGAQLSDDSNPFGVPPSLFHSLIVLAIYLGICATGALLLWGSFRKRRSSA
jgi:hypothetical protein